MATALRWTLNFLFVEFTAKNVSLSINGLPLQRKFIRINVFSRSTLLSGNGASKDSDRRMEIRVEFIHRRA